ncbi:hypothetical protein EDD21DRAFT_413111 [Dissophora ornata]|nr:hypothetical protein EDD21DRAFT_413111 [Dissophora ornata]
MIGLEGVKEFIEAKKENFRYSIYVDNADEYVRDLIYRKTEYVAIPCIVLVVDNEVRFAGSGTKFKEHLDVALKEFNDTNDDYNDSNPIYAYETLGLPTNLSDDLENNDNT